MAHTYESVLQHITGYLHNKLEGAPEVDEHADFTRDLNVNSVQVFEIVEELEETYQIVIPLELLYKQRIQTVAELVREVMRLLEKR
jgi:acyl carrier protein